MATDSPPRRVAKRVLGAVLPGRVYQQILAASVLRDLRAGTLSEPELDLVPALLRDGEVALDIGANHAMWSAAMSAAAGPSGRVLAFEPVPFTAGTFSIVIGRLGLENVELVQAAVGAEPGELTLSVPIQSSGVADSARVHLAARDRGEAPGRERRITVEAVRLDDRSEELNEVALIKIDIEGAELFALQGALGLIERDRPAIVCEVDPEFLSGFDLSPHDVTGLLAEHGYDAWRYRHGAGLERIDASMPTPSGNYVFLHPDRRDRVAEMIDS